MMSTKEDLAQAFHHNGFLHMKSMVKKDTCEKLVLRMRELVARFAPKDRAKIFETGAKNQTSDQHFLQSARNISFFFDRNSREEDSIFGSLNKVGHALHDLCPVYRRFSHDEKFYDLMKILGHKKSRLVQSMFIFKQPFFGDAVPAHQDATFINTDPPSTIGLWFAFQDADESNGCLWVLPKAHKGLLKERFLYQDGRLRLSAHNKVDWPSDKFIPLRAQAGDVIILDGLLPHRSEQNFSPKTRFAYTLHFVDKQSHFSKQNWLNIGG
jgi:phytanoyl-CoA hydroxylase